VKTLLCVADRRSNLSHLKKLMLCSDKSQHVIEVRDISPDELPDLGVSLAQGTNYLGIVAKRWAGSEALRRSRRIGPLGGCTSSIYIHHQLSQGVALESRNGGAIVQERVDVVEVTGPALKLFELARGGSVVDEGQLLSQRSFRSEYRDLKGCEIAVLGAAALGYVLNGRPQQRLDDTALIR
jgi:hypothetical protein